MLSNVLRTDVPPLTFTFTRLRMGSTRYLVITATETAKPLTRVEEPVQVRRFTMTEMERRIQSMKIGTSKLSVQVPFRPKTVNLIAGVLRRQTDMSSGVSVTAAENEPTFLWSTSARTWSSALWSTNVRQVAITVMRTRGVLMKPTVGHAAAGLDTLVTGFPVRTWTNVQLMLTIVTEMLHAPITSEVSVAPATLDTMVTVFTAMTMTNATWAPIIVTQMLHAPTIPEVSIALVTLGILDLELPVRTMTNAHWARTTAMLMPPVPTMPEASRAPVILDIPVTA